MALAPLAALPAAASAEDCFYIPASSIAKALGLAHATAYLNTAPNPSLSAPTVFSLCRAVAWNGSKPTTAKQKKEKEAKGSYAAVVIKTQEQSPNATPEEIEGWHSTYRKETVAFLIAGKALAEHNHGTIFVPPAFGAEFDHAFTAGSGPDRGAVGIWYDEQHFAYITVGVVTRRVTHAGAALEKLAAKAVPSFGL